MKAGHCEHADVCSIDVGHILANTSFGHGHSGDLIFQWEILGDITLRSGICRVWVYVAPASHVGSNVIPRADTILPAGRVEKTLSR